MGVEIGRPNPNLSLATRFGNLVFVSGQTGRHPVSGEVGKGGPLVRLTTVHGDIELRKGDVPPIPPTALRRRGSR